MSLARTGWLAAALVLAAPAAAGAQELPLPDLVVWGPGGSEAEAARARLAPPALDPPPRRIIFVNRDGGLYHGSPIEDSTLNLSTIVPDDRVVDGWITSDENWREMVGCLRLMFGPFNVEITDQDPGMVDHIECVVARDPVQIDGSGFSGVSPGVCGVGERNIVWVFASVITGGPQRICEVAAQEIAHSYGLDHELLCEDPMTYLGGCGEKTFQNFDAQCHDMNLQPTPTCRCGGATQNSVTLLHERIGQAETELPVVTIAEPADGATVAPGFPVAVTATDNYIVMKVDLWVDGVQRTGTGLEPFMLTAPADLTAGVHMLEARAYDPSGNFGTQTISVTVTGECQVAGDCGAQEVCEGGVCLGDVGHACAGLADCASGSCAFLEGTGNFCTATCTPGDGTCPSGYECSTAGGGNLDKCWPSTGGGGGCAAAGGAGGGGALGGALLAMVAILATRKRRG